MLYSILYSRRADDRGAADILAHDDMAGYRKNVAWLERTGVGYGLGYVCVIPGNISWASAAGIFVGSANKIGTIRVAGIAGAAISL